MNDVRVVVDNSSRNYGDLRWANTKTVAQDLADMVVCGTMQQVLYDFGILDVDQVEQPYYWQRRDRFHSERRRPKKSSRVRQ